MRSEALILAIETGGTKIQAFLGTGEGEILFRQRMDVDPRRGPEGILETVYAAIGAARERAAGLGAEVSRIGFGFGGPVDEASGRVLGSMQIPGWAGFGLAEHIRARFGIETSVFNDTDSATWGEYVLGAGRGTDIFFYTNIGSGIGGGVVIHGRLFTGQGLGACEFGQTFVSNPRRILQSDSDRLETLCSGWAIERHLGGAAVPPDSVLMALCGGDQSRLTAGMLGEAASRGDAYASELLDEIARLFARGLANALCFYSPECIAIGGGVSLIGEPLIGRLRRFTDEYVYLNSKGTYRIQQCELGEDAVSVGVLLRAGAM